MIAILSLTVLLSLAQAPPVAQNPPAQTPPKPGATPVVVQGDYEFTTDLGVFIVVVKADKATAFDAAMGRLRQAFFATSDNNRKAQGAGWRVLKSSEDAVDGAITYLWLIDPVSKAATYDPIKILREISPTNVQPVYDQLQASVVSITRVGLKELLKMGGS